jgi:hypothetical protein
LYRCALCATGKAVNFRLTGAAHEKFLATTSPAVASAADEINRRLEQALSALLNFVTSSFMIIINKCSSTL